jgi:hypothetical protein
LVIAHVAHFELVDPRGEVGGERAAGCCVLDPGAQARLLADVADG